MVVVDGRVDPGVDGRVDPGVDGGSFSFHHRFLRYPVYLGNRVDPLG